MHALLSLIRAPLAATELWSAHPLGRSFYGSERWLLLKHFPLFEYGFGWTSLEAIPTTEVRLVFFLINGVSKATATASRLFKCRLPHGATTQPTISRSVGVGVSQLRGRFRFVYNVFALWDVTLSRFYRQ